MNRRQFLGLGSLAVGSSVLATLAGCTTNQLLGAANLVENGDTPAVELAYGPGERQRCDVYRPLDAAGKALAGPLPLVVFVHGGSWMSGDKNLYRWVGQALAQQGFVAVLANYGLMPSVRFPDFANDVAAAVAFAHTHAAEWGADPSRLFLMGHSAGAHLTALVTYDGRYLARHGLTPGIIAGYIGLSGPYDFQLNTPLLRGTFAGPSEREHDAQPVNFVSASAPRSLLVMGRDDTTVNPHNTRSLAEQLRRVGAPVEELWVDGDHGVTVGAFARIYRAKSPIVAKVVEFVRHR